MLACLNFVCAIGHQLFVIFGIEVLIFFALLGF
jgi:hypothetical protein